MLLLLLCKVKGKGKRGFV